MARPDVVVRLAAVGLLTLSARGQWAVSYVADVDGDQWLDIGDDVVGIRDFLALLASWRSCP